MNSHDNHSNDELSRRRWLIQTAGFLSTAPVVASANADPSIISAIQGPVQDVIAPGHWLGQLFGINSKTMLWKFPNTTPETASQALVDVLTTMSTEQRSQLYIPNFDITKADASKVHVRTWTKNEWLDSLDVNFSAKEDGSCIAKASFYATGFLPTSIPGAPLVNIGFAWFPFASPGPGGQMLQDYRLRVLERLVKTKLQESA